MSSRAKQALIVAVVLATFLGWLQLLGSRLLWIWLVALVVGLLVWGLPLLITQHFSDLRLWLRGLFWSSDEGSLYRFGDVILRMEDDGRHMWVEAAGLMRATGRQEPEDAIAARHAGHWERHGDGKLLLRVDAVVRNLATQAGREDPRIQRLRRYLERDVLYPASQRRARSH